MLLTNNIFLTEIDKGYNSGSSNNLNYFTTHNSRIWQHVNLNIII